VKERRDSQMARLHKKLQAKETSRVFARLADAFRQNDHVEEAIELCHRGLEHHPDYISGHIVLGQCYLDLGRLGEAKEAFLRALVLDEENVLVLKNLGDILGQQGDRESAAHHYRQALELDPRNTDLAEMLREAQTQPGETSPGGDPESQPEAEPLSWPAAMEVSMFGRETLEEHSPEEHRRWILAEASDNGTQGAEAELSPVESELLREAELEPSDKGPPRGMATATLAEIYFQQGFLEKAIEIYQKVVRNNPQDARSRDRLAELRALRSSRERDQGQDQETSPGPAAAQEQAEEMPFSQPDQEER